jgi:general secretion pathway protein M
MFSKFTLKQQKWIAVGFLSVATLTIVLIFVVPLLGIFYDNQDEIENLTHQLERLKKTATSREQVLSEATQIKDKIKSSTIFSSKDSPVLALADMQQKIKTTITQAHGELISTQNLIPKQKQSEESLTKIGINVRFSGQIDALMNILFEFESARPVMIIENIKITGVRGVRNSTTGKMDPIDKVDVSMDIVSFLPSETH